MQDKEERKDIVEQRSEDHIEVSENKNEHESESGGVVFRNFWNKNANENRGQGDGIGNLPENGDAGRLSDAKIDNENENLGYQTSTNSA